MSSSPEDKNLPTNTPNPAPQQAANSAPATPASPASPTTPSAQTSTPQASDTPIFKSDNIGQWHAKQGGFFSEQNRQAAEKKAKSDHRKAQLKNFLKTTKPYLIIGGVVVAVGLIIWGITALIINITNKPNNIYPVVDGVESSTPSEYRYQLQKYYDENNGNLEAVDKLVAEDLKNSPNEAYTLRVKATQMVFYMNNGYCDRAKDIGAELEPNYDKLDLEDQISYYYSLRVCTPLNSETEDLYWNYVNKTGELLDQINNAGEEYDEVL